MIKTPKDCVSPLWDCATIGKISLLEVNIGNTASNFYIASCNVDCVEDTLRPGLGTQEMA